jgi:hypothetical protein
MKRVISVVKPKDQKDNQYFFVCENYLTEEIKSISESESFYDLYSDLIDSSSCHTVGPYFGNKIQSDERKQEGYQTCIDQTYNESKCSFNLQNFDNFLNIRKQSLIMILLFFMTIFIFRNLI